MIRKLGRATVIALLLVFILVGMVSAITITVDGIREVAWDGGGSASDPNEAGVSDDGVDVSTFEWTNDTTNFYFLIETYTTTNWNRPVDQPYVYLCLNTDNSSATGIPLPGNCLADGYDRFIRISGPTPLTVTVLDETGAVIPTATTAVATSGSITEISVSLATLGFDSTNCGPFLLGVYMDGRTGNPDDNVLDGGDIPVTCGTPTAVTLQSLSADSQAALPVAGLVSLLLLTLLSAGYLFYRKRHA